MADPKKPLPPIDFGDGEHLKLAPANPQTEGFPVDPEAADLKWKTAALLTRLGGGLASGVVGAIPQPEIGFANTALAGAIGGGAEAIAQMLEAPKGTSISDRFKNINKARVGTEAALSGVPMGKIYKAGQKALSIARGAGLAELGNLARRKAATGEYAPHSLEEAAWDVASTGLGGAFGLIPMNVHSQPPSPSVPLEEAAKDAVLAYEGGHKNPVSGVRVWSGSPVGPKPGKVRPANVNPEMTKEDSNFLSGFESNLKNEINSITKAADKNTRRGLKDISQAAIDTRPTTTSPKQPLEVTSILESPGAVVPNPEVNTAVEEALAAGRTPPRDQVVARGVPGTGPSEATQTALARPANQRMTGMRIATARQAAKQAQTAENAINLKEMKADLGGTDIPSIAAAEAKSAAARKAQTELDRLLGNLPVKQDPTYLSTPLSGVGPDGLPLRGSIRHVAEDVEKEVGDALGGGSPTTPKAYKTLSAAQDVVLGKENRNDWKVVYDKSTRLYTVERRPPENPNTAVTDLDLNNPNGPAPIQTTRGNLTPEQVEPAVGVPSPEPTAKISKPKSGLRVKGNSKKEFALANFSPEANTELDALFGKLRSLKRGDPAREAIAARIQEIDKSEFERLAAEIRSTTPQNSAVSEGVPTSNTDVINELQAELSNPNLGQTERSVFEKALENLKKNQSGFVSPQTMLKLASTGLGAAAGAKLDEDDPLTGAVLGGAVGLGGASVIPHLLKGVSDQSLREFGQNYPTYFRSGLLSHPLSILYNGIGGPLGSQLWFGAEQAIGGKTPEIRKMGREVVKDVFKVGKNMKGYLQGMGKAARIIQETERSGGVDLDMSKAYNRLASVPAVAMTSGDDLIRGNIMSKGFSPKQAREASLTNEPGERFPIFAGAAKFNKVAVNKYGVKSIAAQLALPFSRTLANIGESGLERLPGLGPIVELIGKRPEHRDTLRMVMGRQAVSIPLFWASYAIGASVPEGQAKSMKLHSLISNLGGQYALVTSAGFAAGQARRLGRSQARALSVDTFGGVPLPSFATLEDIARPFLKGITGEPVTKKDLLPQSMVPSVLKTYTPSTSDISSLLDKIGQQSDNGTLRLGPQPPAPNMSPLDPDADFKLRKP